MSERSQQPIHQHHLHFSVIAAHLNSAVISNNNANIKSCCWHTILKVTKLLPSPMLAAYPPLLTRMLHEHAYLSQLFWSGLDQYLLQITTSLVASKAHVVFWQHDCLKFVSYLIYKNTHAQCLRLIVCCVFAGSLCRQRLSETVLKHLSGQRLVSMQPYSTSEVYRYRPAVKRCCKPYSMLCFSSSVFCLIQRWTTFVLFGVLFWCFVNDEKLVWRWTSRCIMHKPNRMARKRTRPAWLLCLAGLTVAVAQDNQAIIVSKSSDNLSEVLNNELCLVIKTTQAK